MIRVSLDMIEVFINMNANVLRSGAYKNLDAPSFRTLVRAYPFKWTTQEYAPENWDVKRD
jgi:hypothetical protein